MTYIAAPCSSVHHHKAGTDVCCRLMVMRTDQHVHTMEAGKQIQSLILQDGAIPLAGAGMDQHHNGIGLDAFAEGVYPILDIRDKRHVRHAAPQLLCKPVVYVGVVVAKYEYLPPAFVQQHAFLEIKAAVWLKGIAAKPGHAELLHLGIDAVVHRVAGFYVMVAQGACVVTHVFCHARIDVRLFRCHVVVVI